MPDISFDQNIHCRLIPGKDLYPFRAPISVEVFFAETNELIPDYPVLNDFINKGDKDKAAKFHFEADRDTWLFCHTLLRLVISRKLGIKTSEVRITSDINNKPWLNGNKLFFNISHTRDAFAFAITEDASIGIDLEKIDRNVDFKAIISTFFSTGETNYILEDPSSSRDKFFLLWTRKEALLKALGTGITDKLQDIELFMEESILNRRLFDNLIDDNFFRDHFIYSGRLLNNYMSIAVPSKARLIYTRIDHQFTKTILQNAER